MEGVKNVSKDMICLGADAILLKIDAFCMTQKSVSSACKGMYWKKDIVWSLMSVRMEEIAVHQLNDQSNKTNIVKIWIKLVFSFKR